MPHLDGLAVCHGLQPADAATCAPCTTKRSCWRGWWETSGLALAESGQLPLHRSPVLLAEAVDAALAAPARSPPREG